MRMLVRDGTTPVAAASTHRVKALTATWPMQSERVSNKCVFFVRINPKGVGEKSLETDLAAGEIQGSALDTFRALVTDVYLPVLQEQSGWGRMTPEHTRTFLAGTEWRRAQCNGGG